MTDYFDAEAEFHKLRRKYQGPTQAELEHEWLQEHPEFRLPYPLPLYTTSTINGWAPGMQPNHENYFRKGF